MGSSLCVSKYSSSHWEWGDQGSYTEEEELLCTWASQALFTKETQLWAVAGSSWEDVLPKFLCGPASSPMFGLVAEVHIPWPQWLKFLVWSGMECTLFPSSLGWSSPRWNADNRAAVLHRDNSVLGGPRASSTTFSSHLHLSRWSLVSPQFTCYLQDETINPNLIAWNGDLME